jgi:hypothetical protein
MSREQERFAKFGEAYRKEIARLKSERNWLAVGFVVLFIAWFFTIVAAA